MVKKLVEVVKYLCDCIIYVRVSTLTQADGFSPEAQKKIGIDYCKNKGWSYVIKEELGKSASSDTLRDRDVLQEILVWAQQKRFKYLFVVDPDRLSRKLEGYVAIKQILEDSGIQLVTSSSVTDFNDPMQGVQANLQAVISEYENAIRILRFIRGKKVAKESGLYIGGIRPFGYRIEKRIYGTKTRSYFVVDERESMVYKEIVEMYFSGKSTIDIALELNKKGYRSPKGYEWQSGSIQRILKNPMYKGKQDGNGNWIIEPLITEDKWDAIQKILARNLRRGKGKQDKSLVPLRDKIECGCGSGKLRYADQTIYRNPKWHYEYFYCKHNVGSKEDKSPRCPVRVDVGRLLDDVLIDIESKFGNPVRLKEVIKGLVEMKSSDRQKIESEILNKRKELEKIGKVISFMQDLLLEQEITKSQYDEKKRSYFNRKAALEEDIVRLQERLQIDDEKRKRIEKAKRVLPAFINSKTFLENKAFWIEYLIEKVVVYPKEDGKGFSYKIYYAIDMDKFPVNLEGDKVFSEIPQISLYNLI